mmetsp:Transcript_54582/g.119677  ORF Transcript_54582/g.119677 Transcript_54582/m.119677 type:complete len:222 (+) Transcript_54582:74-739(+)|eukprot:CAMPEP_0204255706 /NCGR_PEP_ID=MMETSP0468-20130131/3366_1 /ASSEMBLY_ACC=CAM_ASM_000383 /TAXON_ID=2969 /ORGANISM="Oxyrrhis marina" /LENGTH=221 /DNA_ID=CAMNT_0051229605 /DNA_START=53 /DNA_END=718 /DNA_ORIENTATION=+
MSAPKWLPLESNPDVLTQYAHKLGMPGNLSFAEILSTEDWALDMVPKPVHAVVFLFPISEISEKHSQEQGDKLAAEGQTVAESLWYTKQTVGNACGTIGVLHAVANADGVPPAGWFAKFFEETKALSPEERAKALEGDQEIAGAHAAAEAAGETASQETVETHFICLVPKDGNLYELDGRKRFPINHGPCTDVLKDSSRVCQEFISRDANEVRFWMAALVG